MKNQIDQMVILVEVKAMHIEEVEDVVIIDLRNITKLEIQEDKLMIHKE